MALELDMIGTAAFASNIALKKDVTEVRNEDGTTDMSTAQVDAKVLRSASQNGIALAVALFNNSALYRELVIMTTEAGPLRLDICREQLKQ